MVTVPMGRNSGLGLVLILPAAKHTPCFSLSVLCREGNPAPWLRTTQDLSHAAAHYPLLPRAAGLHSGPQLSIWTMGPKLDNKGSLRDGPRGSASPADPGPVSPTPAGDRGERRRPGRGGGVGAFLEEFFLFLKSPQLKKRLLPPSCACHVGRPAAAPVPRPSPGWASSRSFGFTLVPPVSLSGRRKEGGRARAGESTGGSVGHRVSAATADLRGLPPAAPTSDLPPGLGILLSPGGKVKGSRSSSLSDCGRGKPPPPSGLLSPSPPPC